MVEASEFGRMFKKLCRRFGRKENSEQAEIYFSRFQGYNPTRLNEAIEKLIDEARLFPTPGEIRKVYYNIHKEEKRIECEYCEGGFVFFEINGEKFANPCAHCMEKSTAPQVARLGKKVFWAYRKTNEIYDGFEVYQADLKNMTSV